MNYTERILLHVISLAPRTRADIQAATGMSAFGVLKPLRFLREQGLVFVDGHRRGVGNKAPIYRTHVMHAPPNDVVKPEKGCDRSAYAAIVLALKEQGPMTSAELADWLGASRCSVVTRIQYYRSGKRKGQHFRIAKWTYQTGHGGGWVAMYEVGQQKDAPKPKRDVVANQVRYRQKVRHEDRAKRYAKSLAAKGVSAVVSPFDQLFRHAGATCSRYEEVACAE